MSQQPPVLVVGPGALGTFLAARLAANGRPVAVACRTSRTADEIAARGLIAEDHRGRRVVAEVPAVVAPEELQQEPGVVVLATKCGDAAQALATWLPHVPDDAVVVGMQNGLMAETLAPMAPGRYIDTVVHFPAQLEAPGHSLQTGPGGFTVGVWPDPQVGPGTEDQARAVVATLRDAAPTDATDNIRGAKWTKLVVNSCITSLGVVTGRPLGALLKDRRARAAFIGIATEGHRVGIAEGVRFAPVQGFVPQRFSLADRDGGLRRAYLHQLLRIVGARYRRHRSSSLQSLARGHRTEVDFLNGVIVRHGRAHSIETPVDRVVVDIVHDIERGHAESDMGHLDRLAVRAP